MRNPFLILALAVTALAWTGAGAMASHRSGPQAQVASSALKTDRHCPECPDGAPMAQSLRACAECAPCWASAVVLDATAPKLSPVLLASIHPLASRPHASRVDPREPPPPRV